MGGKKLFRIRGNSSWIACRISLTRRNKGGKRKKDGSTKSRNKNKQVAPSAPLEGLVVFLDLSDTPGEIDGNEEQKIIKKREVNESNFSFRGGDGKCKSVIR